MPLRLPLWVAHVFEKNHMATRISFNYNYNDTNKKNVEPIQRYLQFCCLKFRQPSTKCSETTTFFVEKLTNLSQRPLSPFFNVGKGKSIQKSIPASEKSHSTLTRGEGRVCLTIFVEGCRKL